ncbi:MAG TPA: YraN family protein [Candidatus Saccharimonadales bacterium]|jgi:putative endonuclease
MTRSPDTAGLTVTSIDTGNRAEQAAAEYLVRQGYEVLERNYRRPHCEIDIVARLDDVICFIEVKYRSTNSYGSGFEYIDGRKLLHMQRGAATWVASHGWLGEYVIGAVEVGGPHYEVFDFIDCIE